MENLHLDGFCVSFKEYSMFYHVESVACW